MEYCKNSQLTPEKTEMGGVQKQNYEDNKKKISGLQGLQG